MSDRPMSVSERIKALKASQNSGTNNPPPAPIVTSSATPGKSIAEKIAALKQGNSEPPIIGSRGFGSPLPPVPKTPVSVPKTTEKDKTIATLVSSPKAEELAPKATEPISKTTEPTPKAMDPVSKTTEPAPKAVEPRGLSADRANFAKSLNATGFNPFGGSPPPFLKKKEFEEETTTSMVHKSSSTSSSANESGDITHPNLNRASVKRRNRPTSVRKFDASSESLLIREIPAPTTN